jgi:hypothetical protein
MQVCVLTAVLGFRGSCAMSKNLASIKERTHCTTTHTNIKSIQVDALAKEDYSKLIQVDSNIN